MKMTRDQLEFAISQYIDGALSPLELAALEQRLATDPEARELLEEYRILDVTMKNSLPAPQVAWDRFADHLSNAIAQEAPPQPGYSLAAWRRAATLALAACIALVVGIAFLSYNTRESVAVRAAPVSIVAGPQPETSTDLPVLVQVTVGPAPTLSNLWRYAESVVSRPTLVMIDRGVESREDGDSIW